MRHGTSIRRTGRSWPWSAFSRRRPHRSARPIAAVRGRQGGRSARRDRQRTWPALGPVTERVMALVDDRSSAAGSTPGRLDRQCPPCAAPGARRGNSGCRPVARSAAERPVEPGLRHGLAPRSSGGEASTLPRVSRSGPRPSGYAHVLVHRPPAACTSAGSLADQLSTRRVWRSTGRERPHGAGH